MGGKKAGKATSLEFYIKFLDNPKDTDLTVDQLNKIISMHGFRKLHRTKKKDILEALSSIELSVPSRSTLKENITSAFLPPEKTIEDLISLQWHECSVQSVETIGWNKKLSDSPPAGENSEKLLKKRKRKSTKKLDALVYSASASVADTAMLTPPGSSCASHGSC
ncbi:hypothetical protein FRX31_003300 [Thalictrum thalictroides]|uniref:DUF7787 domain-containing protein n=1 Tax=Thalictrum thalictroides TaxID=46969 RepID=A0A7J6XBI8_THATH|nr:hypothetical protein FRX31_003300 [Thalictrum thalictroides]